MRMCVWICKVETLVIIILIPVLQSTPNMITISKAGGSFNA